MKDTGKKLTLEQREIKLVEVELMMLKGTLSASKIASRIGCSVPTAQSYIEAIQTRRGASKGYELEKMRLGLIEKTGELEEGYWEAVKTADNSSAKVGALNGILEVQKFQAMISGVSKVFKD